MKKIILYLLLFCSSLLALEEYHVFKKAYFNSEGKLFITLRKWHNNTQTYYLVANPQTLQTTVQTLDDRHFFNLNEDFLKTPLARMLYAQGVFNEAGKPQEHTLFLTMDMCPSLKNGYETDFIEQLTTLNGKTPLAIAITSGWVQKHETSFKELISNPLLDITWINHTHTHFYDKTLPNHQNFMLHANTDVQSEILELEKTLIARGLTPSLFFRFPGLVFDEALVRKVKEEFFLLPIGSRAWIAKGEEIKKGSFILIHGNKNEPQGIKSLSEKLPYLLKNYSFKPLYEAF